MVGSVVGKRFRGTALPGATVRWPGLWAGTASWPGGDVAGDPGVAHAATPGWSPGCPSRGGSAESPFRCLGCWVRWRRLGSRASDSVGLGLCGDGGRGRGRFRGTAVPLARRPSVDGVDSAAAMRRDPVGDARQQLLAHRVALIGGANLAGGVSWCESWAVPRDRSPGGQFGEWAGIVYLGTVTRPAGVGTVSRLAPRDRPARAALHRYFRTTQPDRAIVRRPTPGAPSGRQALNSYVPDIEVSEHRLLAT